MDVFMLKLTKAQLDVVFTALVELPFKVSQPLIQAITQQAQAQMPKANPTVAVTPAPVAAAE